MRLVIYGAKEFSKVVYQLALDCGHTVAGFIDGSVSKEVTEGDQQSDPQPVMTYNYFKSHYAPSDVGVALAVGYKNLKARHDLYLKIKKDGYRLPALIHKTAYVHPTTEVAEGCIVMATASVDVFCHLSEVVTLWPGSIVSHDSHIGANTFISPGATLCGFTKVGSHSFIGAGAVVVDHLDLPENSFIKAGSVFTGSSKP